MMFRRRERRPNLLSPRGLLGRRGLPRIAGLVLTVAMADPSSLPAQSLDAKTRDQAPLIVDGIVREVFHSDRQGRTDYVVQIEVQRSEARRLATVEKSVRFAPPAPGDSVYIHLSDVFDPASRLSRDASSSIPRERSLVRVYLTPRDQGGWQGFSEKWFELTEPRQAEATSSDPAPSAPERPRTSTLGLKLEEMKVQDRLAFRVVRVERESPAQKAGLEEGDVIIGANNAVITGAGQLEELNQRGQPFTVVVVDVNTSRTVPVEIHPNPSASGTAGEVASNRPSGAPSPPSPPSTPTNAPVVPPQRQTLGISAEPTRVGLRTVLKVLSVETGSAAAKAGLEPGDLLVKANGAALTSPEQLVSALRKSGSMLKLTVRDSRTGRDTEVAVNLGSEGAAPASRLPTPVEVESSAPGAGAGGGPLGAVTELAFHDADCAVRITEVVPGGPADRAGLRPGLLIIEANGKPTLHPNQLNEAVRTGGRSLKLVVVDPSTGRKSNAEVKF